MLVNSVNRCSEPLREPRHRCRSWVDLTGGSEFKTVRALIAGRGRESKIGVHLGQYYMGQQNHQQEIVGKRYTV